MVDDTELVFKSIVNYVWGMRTWHTLLGRTDPAMGAAELIARLFFPFAPITSVDLLFGIFLHFSVYDLCRSHGRRR